MYLLLGGIASLPFAALSITLIMLDVKPIVAWTCNFFFIAAIAFAVGSSHRLRSLDLRITNRMLGTSVLMPKANVATDMPTYPLWRRILGLIPGYPAWRATLWFFTRALFGLLTLGMALEIVFRLLPTILKNLLDNASSITLETFPIILWSIVLGGIATAISLSAVGAWTYLPASFFASAASQLLGPSSVERLAELRERLHQQTQRDRLRRAIHNSVGRSLTGIVRHASSTSRRVYTDPDLVYEKLTQIESVARTAHDELNKALADQNEYVDDEPPSRGDLERYLHLITEEGLQVSADLSGNFDDLPDFLRQEIYDVVEEGCTNIYRHADGAPTHVAVLIEDNKVEVTIANDPPTSSNLSSDLAGSGKGLRDVEQRLEALCGSLEAHATDEGGYLLHALVPFPTVTEE